MGSVSTSFVGKKAFFYYSRHNQYGLWQPCLFSRQSQKWIYWSNSLNFRVFSIMLTVDKIPLWWI